MEIIKEIAILTFISIISCANIVLSQNAWTTSTASSIIRQNQIQKSSPVSWISSTSTTPWPELGQKRPNANTKPQSTINVNTRPNSQYIQQPIQNSYASIANNNKQISAGLIQNEKSTESSSIGPKSTEATSSPKKTSSPSPNLNEDEELFQFAEELLQKDTNNAVKYVNVNYQGKTSSSSKVDQAQLPLLDISKDIMNHPTISKLILFYNNYILDTAANEYITPQERNEENNLLDAILPTAVFQHTRNFLIKKDKIPKDPKQFRELMKKIWFNMYSRGGGKIGSSGFEHVFLAELKNNVVSGLHNWVYFSDEEKKNNANYLGYMKKIDLNNKGAILKYHFEFYGKDKPVGSMFIGTSPELEMALYTTCFILRPDLPCPLKLGGNRLVIRTYTYRYRGSKMIGSAFPEI